MNDNTPRAVGAIINEKYEIHKILGSGGMGQVYKVWDKRLEKYWAVKAVEQSPGHVNSERSMRSELYVLKNVNHPFFPRIVDICEDSETFYLVMDLIEGHSLEEHIEREGMLSIKEAVQVGIQLAQALSQLHCMRPPVLYLDLKPSNIMLKSDGKLCLVDFGSAIYGCKRQSAYAGTPGYASPEQLGAVSDMGTGCRGSSKDAYVDERSDLYSLGAVLYHMVTGVHPMRGPGPERIRHLRPEAPEGLCRIIQKAMSRKCSDRFASACEMGQALGHYREYTPGSRIVEWVLQLAGVVLFLLAAWQGAVLLENLEPYLTSPIQSVILEDWWKAGSLRFLFLTGACYLWENLLVEQRKKRRLGYIIKKNVLLTDKKTNIWLGIFAAAFVWMIPQTGAQASELYIVPKDNTGSSLISASEAAGRGGEVFLHAISGSGVPIMRDEHMRKILVRRGEGYRTADPVYIEIPEEMLREYSQIHIYIQP